MVSGSDVPWTAADMARLCAVGLGGLRPGAVGFDVDGRRRSEDRDGRVGRAVAADTADTATGPTVAATGDTEVEACIAGGGGGNLKLTVYDLARGSGRDNAPIGSGDGYVRFAGAWRGVSKCLPAIWRISVMVLGDGKSLCLLVGL